MSIKQFNGRYLQDEDRLLFRLNTSDQGEYRFLLTRRVTGLLLADGGRWAIQTPSRRGPVSSAVAVAAFEQEVLRHTIDFSEPFEKGAHHPLGTLPCLVVHATFSSAPSHDAALTLVQLTLHDRRAVTFRLPLAPLRSMLALLEQLQRQARWEIPAAAADADPMSRIPAGVPGSSLH